jgi:NADH dehydrogenase [ubiquinone] 1 alpha subcomplex assembly factor 7
MGTPRRLHLVELGPGRGSMMRCILGQIKYAHPQLFHFLQVTLVEIAAARVEEQKKALADYQTATGKIKWVLSPEAILTDNIPVIILSNEYFDALPIAKFQFTGERAWCETCLDVDEDPSHEAHLKYVHAPQGSFSAFLIPDDVRANAQVGTAIEINAMGMQVMEQLCLKLVAAGKGVMIAVDYGKDEHMSDTLRGIRGHKFVDPLLAPGENDLSVWVSFKQLRWALERLDIAQQYLKWFPLITQRRFLEENGIDIQLARVLRDADSKKAMKVLQNYRRLMDNEEMGASYKVFTVQTKNFPHVAPYFDAVTPPPILKPEEYARYKL